jgi:hypothetical protein
LRRSAIERRRRFECDKNLIGLARDRALLHERRVVARQTGRRPGGIGPRRPFHCAFSSTPASAVSICVPTASAGIGNESTIELRPGGFGERPLALPALLTLIALSP